MKRVKATFIVADTVEKSFFATVVMAAGGEIEQYEEKPVPKEGDILSEHGFDALLESALQFANGIWTALKGFFGMSKWAIVMVWEGLRWLWTRGVGKK
jgi:hypothetical protein